MSATEPRDDLRPARTTPNLELPVPADTDPADVVTRIGNLADRLDVAVRPAVVTALPSSPGNGEEVYFFAAAAGLWHLRYNADGGAWDFLGGPPLESFVFAAVGGGWGEWSTFPDSPGVSLPLAGVYDFRASCDASGNPGNAFIWRMGIMLSDFSVPMSATVAGLANGWTWGGVISLSRRHTVWHPQNAVMAHAVVNYPSTWANRYISATPVAVQ